MKHRRVLVLTILLALLISTTATVIASPIIDYSQTTNTITSSFGSTIQPTGANDGGDDDGIPYNSPGGD